jgi:IclR family acetate operon transcriptional repressor
MARTGKPATRHVAAVERALAVLDALVEADDGLGTVETARRTGLSPSTASRVLATLAAGGLVEHEPASGRYRLGVRLVQLGNAVVARLDLRAVARAQLERLVQETGETATLSVPGERDAVTVDFVQSASSVQSVARLGRPSVAHATAAGKVLLAFADLPLPTGRLQRFTPRTITDPRRLAAEVERVREQGWARAVREREEDLSALAAPVRDGRGELAAVLGIQGPAARLDRAAMRAALGPLLAQAAALSDALGWSPREEEGR